MTVLYSDFGDVDTRVLRELWKGIDGIRVLEFNGSSLIDRDGIRKALEEEKDTLLICGHGDRFGCYSPTFSGYVFGSRELEYVRARNVIGIWCNASSFARDNNVKGFFTSMFVSNTLEAAYCGLESPGMDVITESEVKFMRKVCSLIKTAVPLSSWKDSITEITDMDNPVESFNFGSVEFFDGKTES